MKILIHSLMVAVLLSGIANAQTALEVTVTNNAPEGGTHFTPVWFGFHDGSFDSYDGGTASSFELERLAEDGNSTFLADTFAVGGTLISTFITLDASIGVVFTMKALIIVIMGGVGDIRGSIVAAVILGVVETAVATLVDPGLTLASAYFIFVLILLFRPQGLFGRRPA